MTRANLGSGGVLLLVLLSLFSALEALAGVFFLPVWHSGRPFPATAVLCGLANVLVMAAALRLAPDKAATRASVVPLLVWLLVCVVCLFPGPGGSRLLLLAVADWRAPLFLVCGAAPALLYWRFVKR